MDGKGTAMLQFAEALYGLYAEGREGQGLVEYALLLAFIAILCIGALLFLKEKISNVFMPIS